jgi:hypothetical protein
MPTPTFTIDAAAVGALPVATATGVAQTVTPTVAWQSGWTGSATLIILGGTLGHLSVDASHAGVVSAGTTQVGTISLPQGVSLLAVTTAPIPGVNGFSQLNSNGAFYVRLFANSGAAPTYAARMLVTLKNVPASLLPQPAP